MSAAAAGLEVLERAAVVEMSQEWVQWEFDRIIAAEWPQPRGRRCTPPVTAPPRPPQAIRVQHPHPAVGADHDSGLGVLPGRLPAGSVHPRLRARARCPSDREGGQSHPASR